MKPRSDSKLKNLPEEMQEAIIAWARTAKTDEHPGGLQYAREQLAADGIKVSLRAVSEFVSWWQLRERFSSASERAQQIEDLIKEKNPNLSPDRIRELGQALFTMEAMAEKDAQAYVALESLALAQQSAKFKGRIETEKLKLNREKFEVSTCETFLKWYGVRKARSIAESNLSNADKIAKLRAEFFRDVDALEASGEVQLPD